MSIFAELSSNGGTLESSVPLGSGAPTAGAASTFATTSRGQIWTITAEADVFVEFGPSPTGAGSKRRRMKAGTQRQFIAAAFGERVAYTTT